MPQQWRPHRLRVLNHGNGGQAFGVCRFSHEQPTGKWIRHDLESRYGMTVSEAGEVSKGDGGKARAGKGASGKGGKGGHGGWGKSVRLNGG